MINHDERLDRIEQKLDTLLTLLKTTGAATRGASNTASASNDIDVDIDGPRGDPEVRFVPRRWTGADFKGQKFSACDPEFLDMLAEAYEWFAQRDDESGALDKNGTPKSRWSRLDGSRARAWSARLRDRVGAGAGAGAGASTSAKPARTSSGTGRRTAAAGNARPSTDFGDDNDIPF